MKVSFLCDKQVHSVMSSDWRNGNLAALWRCSAISIQPDVVLSVQHFRFPWKEIINLERTVFKVLFYGHWRNYKICFYFLHFVRETSCSVSFWALFVEIMCCTEGLSCEIECTGYHSVVIGAYKSYTWLINSCLKWEINNKSN